MWEVHFDFDGRRKSVRNCALKVVDQNTGVPLDKLKSTTMGSTVMMKATSVSTESDPSTVTENGHILFFWHFCFINFSNKF